MNENGIIKEEKIGEYTIKIIIDDMDPMNPREWDNLGRMACWHRGYNLGDEQINDPDSFRFSLWQQYATDKERLTKIIEVAGTAEYRALKKEYNGVAYDMFDAFFGGHSFRGNLCDFPSNIFILPLYLYNHSGISMNTTGFSCPWDSGQVGWIYAPKDKALKELGKTRISKKLKAKVYEILRSEIKSYDDFLQGNCYGYQIFDTSNILIDSCYGFLGNSSYCLREAKCMVEYLSSHNENINKLPLEGR